MRGGRGSRGLLGGPGAVDVHEVHEAHGRVTDGWRRLCRRRRWRWRRCGARGLFFLLQALLCVCESFADSLEEVRVSVAGEVVDGTGLDQTLVDLLQFLRLAQDVQGGVLAVFLGLHPAFERVFAL